MIHVSRSIVSALCLSAACLGAAAMFWTFGLLTEQSASAAPGEPVLIRSASKDIPGDSPHTEITPATAGQPADASDHPQALDALASADGTSGQREEPAKPQPTLADEAADPLQDLVAVADSNAPPAPVDDPEPEVKPEPVPELDWLTDYAEGMRLAAQEHRNLFLYFHEGEGNAARRAFESRTLTDPKVKEALVNLILVDLDMGATVKTRDKTVLLLKHPAFAEMLGRQGIAIVDMSHDKAPYYGYVVSTFPFTPGKFYRAEALSIILHLPPGTLTQRTMIYAVRVHPEGPASTEGQFYAVLADEANKHSTYQASITLQGHHQWDARFQRINAQLPGGAIAQEVVAESWPNEGLVEACVDCVQSWRQSPGHWGAVRERHPLFGYDIKRGRNGIWYATGIFGRR
jgi:hypothetical protein